MAYSSTNPPYLLTQRIGGAGGSLWGYQTTDAMGTVIATSYFSNGAALQMRVGDAVLVTVLSTAGAYADSAWACISSVTAGAGATPVIISSTST